MSARARASLGLALAALAMSALAPVSAFAQRTHVLVVAGLSGAPEFRTRFDAAVDAVRSAAKSRWAVSDSSLVVLGEDSVKSARYDGQSTKVNVGSAFVRLSHVVKPGDVLLVVLIGHGSGEGPQSKVNLPGPDATAAEYASWLAPFSQQQVVFVNTATGSGDFVPVLAGPGRVVMTATRTALEKNESEFLRYFADALKSDEADADKDGRLSVLEAFRYARTEVTKSYEKTNRMLTEHAVLSDSLVAGRITFGRKATADNPKVAALMAERQALESQVAALRAKKASMDAAAYDAELERLLLAIAEKTAAIKAAGGGI
jgi:outer membrane murein-binding lipoprotein Lpp